MTKKRFARPVFSVRRLSNQERNLRGVEIANGDAGRLRVLGPGNMHARPPWGAEMMMGIPPRLDRNKVGRGNSFEGRATGAEQAKDAGLGANRWPRRLCWSWWRDRRRFAAGLPGANSQEWRTPRTRSTRGRLKVIADTITDVPVFDRESPPREALQTRPRKALKRSRAPAWGRTGFLPRGYARISLFDRSLESHQSCLLQR